jgi:hypothetical protein
MSPTLTSNGTRRAAPAPPPTPPQPLTGLLGAPGNRARMAGGALVLAVCTLGAVIVFGKVGDRHAVLVMARTLEVGKIVQPTDLRAVKVSADPGLGAVPAAQRARVVGRPAAVRLVSGSLLSPAQVGEGGGLPDGMALVGAVLKAGQFPLGLAPGDTVALVTAPGSGAAGTATTDGSGEPATATVVAVELAGDAIGTTTVSLQLPAQAAPAPAMAGAAGRLNLVVVHR